MVLDVVQVVGSEEARLDDEIERKRAGIFGGAPNVRVVSVDEGDSVVHELEPGNVNRGSAQMDA